MSLFSPAAFFRVSPFSFFPRVLFSASHDLCPIVITTAVPVRALLNGKSCPGPSVSPLRRPRVLQQPGSLPILKTMSTQKLTASIVPILLVVELTRTGPMDAFFHEWWRLEVDSFLGLVKWQLFYFGCEDVLVEKEIGIIFC